MISIITPKITPKNKATSKAEYTNTQQDLPVNGYNLVHLTRHARPFGLEGFVLPKKQLIVDPHFQILAFIILVQLTILSKHLSLNKHVGISIQIHSYYHHYLPLVTLCSRSVKQSHWSWAAADSNRVLNLAGKPNTHAWEAKSPTQHFPFLSGSWIMITHLDYRAAPACWPHENFIQRGWK